MSPQETSREKVLDAIRRARTSFQEPQSAEPDIQTIGQQGIEGIGDETCLQRFVDMLQAVGGEGYILSGEEAALSMLRGLIGEAHGQAVLVPPDAEPNELAVSRIIQEMGATLMRPGHVALTESSAAALGITVAQAGIADTGTVVLWHDCAQGRLAALLPPTHAVLLKRSEVFPDKLTYLHEMQRRGVDLGGTPMTWVTGPSLTADIEKVLVRGAHGPRRVIVLLY